MRAEKNGNEKKKAGGHWTWLCLFSMQSGKSGHQKSIISLSAKQEVETVIGLSLTETFIL